MARESFFSVREIFNDRRKLIVFLICVVVSTFSWLIISLGKHYSTTILVPVSYINFPENKTLLNDIPDRLAVNVTGSGFDLLRYDDRLTSDTLIINLDDLNISVYGEYQRGYLDRAGLSKKLQERLHGALAINRVLSDSIVLVFDLKVARLLPVKPRVLVDIARGFVQLDSVMVNPTEIEVYGALSILDTMQFLPTEPVDFGEISKSAKATVAISRALIGKDAALSNDSVELTIVIDQITEKRFMIAPQLINVPDSLQLLTFPNTIEVTAQIPMSKYEEISEQDFKLQVDYAQLEQGYLVLPVNLISWPAVVEYLSVKPDQVEIVISPRE